MKTPLTSSFVFAREIRPKEMMSGSHNLADPPMKKVKTEQPHNVQNG